MSTIENTKSGLLSHQYAFFTIRSSQVLNKSYEMNKVNYVKIVFH